MTGREWTIRRLSGTVGELHSRHPDADAHRQVWLMSPLDTALVLGSTQREGAGGLVLGSTQREGAGGLVLGSTQREGVGGGSAGSGSGVVRRRSGGGAVLVAPHDSVWIDVVIGRDDPLWDDDVNRAPLWLGQVWVAALASMGIAGGEVCGRYRPGRWGRVACFASRGPGEVLVNGAKAVGVSQSRTRTTARFQTLVYRRWTPRALLTRLAVPPSRIDDLRHALTTTAFPVDAPTDRIHAAFLAALRQ